MPARYWSRPLNPMMLARSVLGALAISLALAPLPVAAEPKGAPSIRFDEETHDFGKIPSNQKVSLAWKFRNDGDAPLKILKTKPSCGCTATLVQEGATPAGGAGTIELVFDPIGQFGQVRKSLAVTTNDPRRPVVVLVLKADVVPTDVTPVAGGHPSISGQSMLMGPCGACHARPAAEKSGEDLYRAICAMCHGPSGEGGRAVTLRSANYLASHEDKALADAIAYGTVNPKMPGFSDMMGGPLTQAQIESLVKLLRAWGALAAQPAPGAK